MKWVANHAISVFKKPKKNLFRIKQLEKLPELKPIEKESEVVLKFPEVEKLAGSILILSEVAFAYPEMKPIFENVDLSATMESRICIVSNIIRIEFFFSSNQM